MKIRIEVNTDNDALAGALDGDGEAYDHLLAILKNAVSRVGDCHRNLYDYNGNHVGQVVIKY